MDLAPGTPTWLAGTSPNKNGGLSGKIIELWLAICHHAMIQR